MAERLGLVTQQRASKRAQGLAPGTWAGHQWPATVPNSRGLLKKWEDCLHSWGIRYMGQVDEKGENSILGKPWKPSLQTAH